MPGFPITIVSAGGTPIRPVQDNAPVATIAASGTPVTVSGTGTPFIVEGAPDPTPPGPLDRLVPELDGLDDFSTPYNAVYPNMIVRIVARNNANVIPGFVVKFGTQTLDLIGVHADAIAGHTVLAAYGYRGTPTGTQNLTIQTTGGSAGFAAVRVGEIVSMDASWLGEVAMSINALSGNDYYAEIDDYGPADGSIIGAMAGWMDEDAYPIYASYPETIQYETAQSDGAGHSMAAYFAQSMAPTGEPNGLFVHYSRSGNALSPASMLFELKGAVLP